MKWSGYKVRPLYSARRSEGIVLCVEWADAPAGVRSWVVFDSLDSPDFEFEDDDERAYWVENVRIEFY